ncbi:MAG: hypothetical protein ABIQ06_05190, partial [Caldimonas sp.]
MLAREIAFARDRLQGDAGMGVVRQFGAARRRQHPRHLRRGVAVPTRQMRHKLEARRIGPLQVVEYQDSRRPGREGERLRQRLQQARACFAGRRRRLVPAPVVAEVDLGKQARDVSFPHRGQGREPLPGRRRAKRVSHRVEGRRRRHLGEPQHQRFIIARARRSRVARELEGKARLADAGVALDQDQRREQRRGGGELAFSCDQRCPAQIDASRRRALGHANASGGQAGSGGSRANAFGQQAGLGQRLEAELVVQGPLAALEHLDRRGALAERVVQAHEVAIRGFLQPILVEQFAMHGHGATQIALT